MGRMTRSSGASTLLNRMGVAGRRMKAQGDEMKCPKCGRLELRETPQGVICRICGYALSPGENDKYRLYRLLKEDQKGSRGR